MAKAKRVKRRVKKNIPTGVAHIHASFNNTVITITDVAIRWWSWSGNEWSFLGRRHSDNDTNGVGARRRRVRSERR